jgi:pyruvate, orthophosphate dikinase
MAATTLPDTGIIETKTAEAKPAIMKPATTQYVYFFGGGKADGNGKMKDVLGGKGAGLAEMTNAGLPVPPGFTIQTEACREYMRLHAVSKEVDRQMEEALAKLESLQGQKLGKGENPLLVSVRSGAKFSMPGMMDTILNLGLNDATTAGLAERSGSPKFAANCRQRFESMFRDIVGVEAVPADPWVQLLGAVEAVFRSWNSDRARTYREREGIPDDLGTAVTVQAMVFGNRSVDSGTGVLFTRNPATGEPVPYGDVMFNAQGEDVVAGTHRTEPITCLDERIPAVGRELREYAARLEHHHRDLCDIEFTIEHGKLWMLQCRIGKRSPQAALRIARDMAEDPDFPLTRAEAVGRVAAILADPPTVTTGRGDTGPALAVGLPASPGVGCGEIVTTPDAAVAAAEAGRTVVLVRAETYPDDVHGMARSAGILTATGGLASHAAVVARGWGIPAVVGATGVTIGDGGVTIGGRTLAVGEVITIDGGTGEVFAGAVAGAAQVVPEVVILRAWAREEGIEIGSGPGAEAPLVPAPAAPTHAAAPAPGGLGRHDVLRVLVVKGYATPETVAGALLGAPDEAAAELDRLLADDLAEMAAGQFRLTPDGKSAGRELIAADTAAWGAPAANAALDAFLVLDGRMKSTVTAWQMREVDGTQAFNDHSDGAYDAVVLADLAALHADAAAWLRPAAAALPRLGAYLARLEAANAAAQAGDPRFVASPRVDSYHGVWFELHEDLILLAGRNRADEVAAGRA